MKNTDREQLALFGAIADNDSKPIGKSTINMKAPKRVSSGAYVDLNSLTEKDVNLDDIQNSLNYIYRFTGHHKDQEPLTVAQHTKLVIKLATMLFPGEPEVHFDCLLHDMPEAYYGDIATPLKRLFGDAYKDYTRQIDTVVYNRLWKIDTPFSKEIYEKRKVCDLLSVDIERRSMWNSQLGKDYWPEMPKQDIMFSLEQKRNLFDWAKEDRYIDLVVLYNQGLYGQLEYYMEKDVI